MTFRVLKNFYNRVVNPFYYIDFIVYNMPIGSETLKCTKRFHELTRNIIMEKKLEMKMKRSKDNFEDNSK